MNGNGNSRFRMEADEPEPHGAAQASSSWFGHRDDLASGEPARHANTSTCNHQETPSSAECSPSQQNEWAVICVKLQRRIAPVGKLPFLNDVDAARPPNVLRVDLIGRIGPQDVPGIDAGIVDPQRGAVPVAGDRQCRYVRASLCTVRHHPTPWIARPSSTQPKWISPLPRCSTPFGS